MALRFYNTLSRQHEDFQPLEPGKAGIYSCGPTVYNYAHIGNFRAFVFVDLVRRVLKYCGYEVQHVVNITDVDDKTIRDSQKEGTPLADFTTRYTQYFFDDLKTLRCEEAEVYPRATGHIQEMIDMIATLVEKGHAYQGEDGSVYYSIETFTDYGKLARIDREGQQAGARVTADEYGKESVADFALWKAYQEEDGDVKWDSPWGPGRPGWHIECSAMSTCHLGAHFDIHTGGVDLMFPHHEDEIAQSEGCTGEKFVNYWLHCEHLMVEGAKMSKSKGNFFTLRDITDKGYSGREIRYVLIAGHYRTKINFTFASLDQARASLRRIDDFTRRLQEAAGSKTVGTGMAAILAKKTEDAALAALEDDLNVSGVLGTLFDLMRDVNRALDAAELGGEAVATIQALLEKLDSVLGLIAPDEDANAVPADILAKVEARQAARKAKDFATSDQIRDELAAAGWVIKDTPNGPQVHKA